MSADLTEQCVLRLRELFLVLSSCESLVAREVGYSDGPMLHHSMRENTVTAPSFFTPDEDLLS